MQAFAGEGEVRILCCAAFKAALQFCQERLDRVQLWFDRWLDAVPWQGLGQGTFADFLGVHDVWVLNIRNHALMLGALPGDTVELGQGQFQLTMVERLDSLHGAFAEGLTAEDQCAVVVLHGTGENLRGRG